MRKLFLFTAIVLSTTACFGQAWSGILNAVGSGTCTGSTPTKCAIDWSSAGMPGGTIPVGTQAGSTITATGSDQTSAINAALAACGGTSSAYKYVNLAAGTFTITGTVTPTSYCKLHGQGANQTILYANGTSGNGVVALGMTWAGADPAPTTANDTAITGGLNAGSTSITVASAAHISVGSLLSISELNNINNGVNSTGDEGFCYFCDQYGGYRSSGQVVLVTGVSGTTITISPGLYWNYGSTLPTWTTSTVYFPGTNITSGGNIYKETAQPGTPYNCTSASSGSFTPASDGTCTWTLVQAGTTTAPIATPFTPAAVEAGVENLEIYTVNGTSGSSPSTLVGPTITINQCEYCFVNGVAVNYTDANFVQMDWDFAPVVQSSYFSNAILHASGTFDSTIQLYNGVSQALIQNNIIERGHIGIVFEHEVSGNVVANNFVQASFTPSSNFLDTTIEFHGAHPEFNLIEGNVTPEIQPDSIWGSSSNTTFYRNWATGSMPVDYPLATGRNTVSGGPTVVCSAITANHSCNPFQNSAAFSIVYSALGSNVIGNVVGSSWQLTNLGYGSGVSTYNGASGQTDLLHWTATGSTRSYDGYMYDYVVGYGSVDDGTWTFDSTAAYTTALFHGNYGDVSNTVTWTTGVTHTLPASFYLASKPSWWGSLAYPAIGPDVTGGSGPGGYAALIPAQNCYLNVMGGSYGATGSPLTFNASSCYASSNSSTTQITGTAIISGNAVLN